MLCWCNNQRRCLSCASRLFSSAIHFQVHTATNGEEGLKEMKKRVYDAVFTDIVMPVMDGYESVRQFRQWEAAALLKDRKTKQVTPVTTSTCVNTSALANAYSVRVNWLCGCKSADRVSDHAADQRLPFERCCCCVTPPLPCCTGCVCSISER